MPELPEVETVRRGLEPALLGQTIARVDVRARGLRMPFAPDLKTRMEGMTVSRTVRRGKYILVFSESGEVLVLHLGMSGRMNIVPPGPAYTPEKHDHLIFETAAGGRIVFNDPRRFGMAYLTSSQTWEKESPFAEMGPEPLGNAFSGPVLAEKLKGRGAAIKNALLDQKVVAGIGNIYACEALFDAQIDPSTPAARVHGRRAEKLAGAIRHVLLRALEAGGSTLKDYRHTDGNLGYFQHQFAVYDRAGESCPGCTCDSVKTHGIKRIMQAGRSTFFCPHKQT